MKTVYIFKQDGEYYINTKAIKKAIKYFRKKENYNIIKPFNYLIKQISKELDIVITDGSITKKAFIKFSLIMFNDIIIFNIIRHPYKYGDYYLLDNYHKDIEYFL